MSDIPINPVTRRVQFTGNTGLGPFAFTFNIYVASDIAVYRNAVLLTLTTDYTVTIAANGTGSVTLTGSGSGTTLTISDSLTIVGARQLARTTDFVTAGDLLAVSLNEQLDSNVIMSQQLDEKIDRSIKFDQFDTYTTATLPAAAARASKILAFDINGDIDVALASDFFGNAVLGANYVNNTATGTGSQVAFGLTVSPGSKNNIQVYIDGVYQNKASFSISAATITFSEAPPLNSAIEFIIGQAVTEISGDSDSIDYTQGGTGSQQRTLTSKLQESVSVKDFGATGDGSTDDTAAIQAAVNAANAIYFPPGEYITSLIELSSRTDISLFGGGIGVTTLKMKANIEETIIKLGAGSKRISIKNMTLDGNRTNQTPTGDGINYGILLSGEQIILENLYIKDCATDGIILNSSLINGNYSISNVNVTNSRRNGFSLVQGVNCTVVSSSFNNTTGTAPQAGLDIEPSTVQTVRNIKFIACDFDGNAGDGVTAGLLVSLSSTMEDIQFISCKSRNNSGRGFRVLKYDISNIIFSGCNTTTNGKAGYLTDAESVSFNSCNSFDNDSSAADSAGFVLGANNGMIIGCISQNKNTTNQSYGISITGLATNCNVIGNDLNANNVGAIIGSGSGGITRLFNQGDGASLRRNLYGSKTWDPVSISDGAATSVDVTVTGAVIGNFCVAQLTTLTANDVTISAHVTATDTVRVVIVNHTGGALDVSSGTVSVSVFIF